jgi:hypothetical protein
VQKKILGERRDVTDPHALHKISLIAFLAWVGLGADGLSSSAYGPEEAFRTLGAHTYLAVALAAVMASTVIIISMAYSRIIEQFPHGGGGYVVATRLLGARVGVAAPVVVPAVAAAVAAPVVPAVAAAVAAVVVAAAVAAVVVAAAVAAVVVAAAVPATAVPVVCSAGAAAPVALTSGTSIKLKTITAATATTTAIDVLRMRFLLYSPKWPAKRAPALPSTLLHSRRYAASSMPGICRLQCNSGDYRRSSGNWGYKFRPLDGLLRRQ